MLKIVVYDALRQSLYFKKNNIEKYRYYKRPMTTNTTKERQRTLVRRLLNTNEELDPSSKEAGGEQQTPGEVARRCRDLLVRLEPIIRIKIERV